MSNSLHGKRVAILAADGVKAGKPVAAICHGPWTLVEAGVVAGRTLTSYPSIRTDLRNAGANVVDEEVALDGNVIPADHRMICRRSARRSSGNSGKLRWAPEYYGEVSRFCFMGMNEPKVVIATAFTKLERPP
jgi:hypothetical protein